MITSCPHLCARQGITRRYDVTPVTMARRLLRLVAVIVIGGLNVALRWVLDRVFGTRAAPLHVARLHRKMLRACGVRLKVTGVRETFADPGESVLVVGNHISWLDAMAYSTVQRVTMVSKREVGEWPIIGSLARAAGTIFIDRLNYRSVDATRKEIGRRLRAGETVATFPEATTTCGRGLAHMYPAMFQAAIDVGVPVQPVAFAWIDRFGQLTTAGAYVGEQPMWDSVKAILGQRDLVLRLEILPRIMPKHVRPIDDRKALRTAAMRDIGTSLGDVLGDWTAHVRPVTCQAHPVAAPVVVHPLDELAAIQKRRRRAGASGAN